MHIICFYILNTHFEIEMTLINHMSLDLGYMSSTFRDCIPKNNTVTRENGFGCYDSKKVLNLTEDGETRFVKFKSTIQYSQLSIHNLFDLYFQSEICTCNSDECNGASKMTFIFVFLLCQLCFVSFFHKACEL